MSLKKPRIYISGISNIDYKSKDEIEKIFNNFKNYKIKPDKNDEPIDPTQIVYYKSPKPKLPNMYNVSLKEAKKLDGDSLLYAQTYKLRKELKLKRLEQNVNKKLNINSLPKVSDSNKNIDLDNIKAEQNKQSDEKRLKALRREIQNKLVSHKNVQNVFVSWQSNYLKNNELSLFDLNKRINGLGIPVSYNETLGLISLANKRNTNSLNLDEFKNLFFDDGENINDTKDISSIKIPENINSQKIEDDYKIEEENKYKKYINNKIFDNVNYNGLESLLHVKSPNFLNSINKLNDKENNKNGLCDLQTFKNVLDTLKIPEKYKNISIAKSIFNEYKDENSDLMNYKKFIEKCDNFKKPNGFFEFQNKYLDLLTNKLENNEKKRNECKDILLENDKKTKEYIKNLGASKACKSMDKIFNNNKCVTEINNQNIPNKDYNNKLKNNITIDYSYSKNKRYSTLHTDQNIINQNDRYKNQLTINEANKNKESFSHYQPSFNFIDLMYKDDKKYIDIYNKGVQEFEPNNILNIRKNKRADGRSINCRFFSRKDKFPPLFMSYDNTSPGYISDKERFEINQQTLNERTHNLELKEKILTHKNEINERWNNMIKFQQKYLDVKESLGQIKRTKHLYDYEHRNIIRQQIND